MRIIPPSSYSTGISRRTRTLPSWGKRCSNAWVKPNPNVRLVLCGHICGTAFRSDDLDDNGDGVPDRRVNAMLYDYQDHVIDSGQVRVLTFDPASRGLTVLTYSPPLDRYFRDWFFSQCGVHDP